MRGYENGAHSRQPGHQGRPDSTSSTSDLTKAFNDPTTGKTFAQQFLSRTDVDVMFQVAGKTGNGVLEAACEAGIYGIGVDVDQALSYPNAAKCIVTSAEKHLDHGRPRTGISAVAGRLTEGGERLLRRQDTTASACRRSTTSHEHGHHPRHPDEDRRRRMAGDGSRHARPVHADKCLRHLASQ